jgi:hypothetical protein
VAAADSVGPPNRGGGHRGRVLDERIALRHGVLGQETTGAGGFAMAMRSIPAILGYARILAEVSPRAWTFNFTNPAGLVTQALHDAGVDRAVEFVDGADAARAAGRGAAAPGGARGPPPAGAPAPRPGRRRPPPSRRSRRRPPPPSRSRAMAPDR